MKRVLLGLGFACILGCSGDAFDYPDADDPSPFPAPPHARFALPSDDASAPDASPEASTDGGCPQSSIDVSPYCGGACATADGGMTCGNTTNGACVAAKGFYAECANATDCGSFKVCALADVATVTGTCPMKLESVGQGVTISCADPSYLSVVKSSRPLCRASSPGDCTTYGFSKCVAVDITGYPALSGETIGVCE